MGFRITELWAFCSVDEGGVEGVCAVMMSDGWMPMVGADKARIESLRPHAQEIAVATRRPVLLKRFSTSEVVEEIKP